MGKKRETADHSTAKLAAIGIALAIPTGGFVAIVDLNARERMREIICLDLGRGEVPPYENPRIYGSFNRPHMLPLTRAENAIMSFVPRTGPSFASSNGIDHERARCKYEHDIDVSRACIAEAIRKTLANGHIKLSRALVEDAQRENGECK